MQEVSELNVAWDITNCDWMNVVWMLSRFTYFFCEKSWIQYSLKTSFLYRLWRKLSQKMWEARSKFVWCKSEINCRSNCNSATRKSRCYFQSCTFLFFIFFLLLFESLKFNYLLLTNHLPLTLVDQQAEWDKKWQSGKIFYDIFLYS